MGYSPWGHKSIEHNLATKHITEKVLRYDYLNIKLRNNRDEIMEMKKRSFNRMKNIL